MTASTLILVFTSGLLGSSHCVGMCGPFAIIIGTSSRSLWDNASRQLLYGLGRTMTYGFLGCIMGWGGFHLASHAPRGVSLAAWLAIGSGLMLTGEGLRQAGWLPLGHVLGSATSCLGVAPLRMLLRTKTSAAFFLSGLATGFLPCGLVYAYLALAIQSRNMLEGGAIMLAFGLGTVPLMLATGCSTTMISVKSRQRLLRLAAISLVAVGCLTIYRGIAFLAQEPNDGDTACPFCLTSD